MSSKKVLRGRHALHVKAMRVLAQKLRIEVRVVYDEYVADFYYKENGRWRKLDRIGNTGVALDVAAMLKKLGHIVHYVDLTRGD